MPFTNPIVAGNTLVRQAIQSEDFALNSEGQVSGWQIARDGTATFTNVTIGSTNYNIDTDGNAAFEDITVNGDIFLDGSSLSDFIAGQPGGLITYGDSQSANNTGTQWSVDSQGILATAVGVVEFSFGPALETHIYRINLNYTYTITTTVGYFRHRLFYTVDGSTPTTSGSVIDGSDFTVTSTTTASSPQRAFESYYYYATGDHEIVRCLLTFNRLSTSGVLAVGLTLPDSKLVAAVEDLGLKDTAVNGGSLSQRSKATGTADPDPTKRYTKTYSANWSRSWDNGGASVHTTNGELVQGTYPDGRGDRRAWIGFPYSTIQSDLTGATVNKVEVYLYFDHWYYNGGGTASIGFHNSTATSAPTYDASKDNLGEVSSSSWGVNVGRWVNITTGGAFTAIGWKTGAHTGITISGPSSNLLYYGKARGNTETHEPQLRITYTK